MKASSVEWCSVGICHHNSEVFLLNYYCQINQRVSLFLPRKQTKNNAAAVLLLGCIQKYHQYARLHHFGGSERQHSAKPRAAINWHEFRGSTGAATPRRLRTALVVVGVVARNVGNTITLAILRA